MIHYSEVLDYDDEESDDVARMRVIGYSVGAFVGTFIAVMLVYVLS